jgi:hypothetical protein
MSKGLKFAFHLIDKNINLPTNKLIQVLKPYTSELEAIAWKYSKR